MIERSLSFFNLITVSLTNHYNHNGCQSDNHDNKALGDVAVYAQSLATTTNQDNSTFHFSFGTLVVPRSANGYIIELAILSL